MLNANLCLDTCKLIALNLLFMLFRYMSMLTDKYQAMRKKMEDNGEKSDGTNLGEVTLTIENENFNPASEDFKAEAKDDDVIGGEGRCRPLRDFLPVEDEDMPGNLITYFSIGRLCTIESNVSVDSLLVPNYKNVEPVLCNLIPSKLTQSSKLTNMIFIKSRNLT